MRYLTSILFIFLSLQLEAGDYKRKAFKHWADKDKDCRNTRAEVLMARSKVPVSFRVRKSGKKCTVDSGQWDDFYYNEVLMKASQIDIDHIVPLKHAWESGAANWNPKRREEFANDPENLVVTNLKYNRSKGAQTPLTWMPMDRLYACRYMNKWLYIKKKYGLFIGQKEKNFFSLLKCPK